MIADSVWRTLKGRIARLFSEETRKKAESDGSYRVSLCFAMRFSTKVSESLRNRRPLKRGELRREYHLHHDTVRLTTRAAGGSAAWTRR